MADTPPDTGERRRRNDATGAKAKIEQAAENVWAKAAARLAAPALLSILIWLGSQVWGDIKEQAMAIGDVSRTLEKITGRLNMSDWRIEQMENTLRDIRKNP